MNKIGIYYAFLDHFPCNHIHGTYGNWERELLHAAELLGIEARVFRSGDPIV